MFFKKKSPIDRLDAKYKKLMAEWKKYSTIDRALSDRKYAEAEEVLQEMKKLEE